VVIISIDNKVMDARVLRRILLMLMRVYRGVIYCMDCNQGVCDHVWSREHPLCHCHHGNHGDQVGETLQC